MGYVSGPSGEVSMCEEGPVTNLSEYLSGAEKYLLLEHVRIMRGLDQTLSRKSVEWFVRNLTNKKWKRVDSFVWNCISPGIKEQRAYQDVKSAQNSTSVQKCVELSCHEKSVLAIYVREMQNTRLVRERVEQIIANLTDTRWNTVVKYAESLVQAAPSLDNGPCRFISTGSNACFGLSQFEKTKLYPFVAGYRGKEIRRSEVEVIVRPMNNAKWAAIQRYVKVARSTIAELKQGKSYIQSGRPFAGKLTDKDKRLLREYMGNNPFKKFRQSEVRRLIPNMDNKTCTAAINYVSRVVRPEIKERAGLIAKEQTQELPTTLTKEQLFAMFLFFGRRGGGTVRPRSQRNIVEFLRIYSHLFPGWKPCARTRRKIQNAWATRRSHTLCTEITVAL